METTGIVFDIQRAALYDGPGLRTAVFLKGCPLRCLWCHNPESQSPQPETGRRGKQYGRAMSVETVMETVLADRAYYEATGGGLTVSGGEPTAQFEFCRALLRAAREVGLHTCLDTSGAAPWDKLEALLPHVSLFLYDYKATGDACHKRLTGVGARLPHENLRRLLECGAAVRLRCPLIPGVNDSADHLAAIGRWMREFPEMEADIMPYHETGNPKYEDVGLPVPRLHTRVPDTADFVRWESGIREFSGGRVPAVSGAA